MGVRGTHVYVRSGTQDQFVTISGQAEVWSKGSTNPTPLGSGQLLSSSERGMIPPRALPQTEVARLAVAIVPPPKTAKSLKEVEELSSEPNSAFKSESNGKNTGSIKSFSQVKFDPIADNNPQFNVITKVKAYK